MSRLNLQIFFLVTASSLCTAGGAADPRLPQEWRYPVPDELKGNFIHEQTGKDYIAAVGDFNGDGAIDSAYLINSTEFSGEDLIVSVSDGSEFEWNILNVISWGEEHPNVSVAMGVEVVPPGSYKTACGKGYWTCKDKAHITLLSDLLIAADEPTTRCIDSCLC